MLRHFIHASKLVRLAHFAFRLQFPHQAHSQTQFVWPKKTSSLISASVFQFLLFPKQTQFVWPTFSSLLPAPQAREPVAGRNTEHEQTSPATQFVWPKKRPRPSFRFLFSNFCFSQNKLSSFGQNCPPCFATAPASSTKFDQIKPNLPFRPSTPSHPSYTVPLSPSPAETWRRRIIYGCPITSTRPLSPI
jgi:hypothetical protein